MIELNRETKKSVEPKFAHFEVGNFGERVGKTGQVHKITGHATVAALRFKNRYYYGVALCSPEDNFSRAEGRARALQKLHQPKRHKLTTGIVILTEEDEKTRNSVIAEAVVRNVLSDLQQASLNHTKDRWWYKESTWRVRLKSKKVKHGND